jgi:hypothetical protein
MKKLLILLSAIIISIQLSATDRYISITGSNANSGTIGSPWRNLYYACSHSVSGDVINVGAGIFTETAVCVLPAGVSIVGVVGTPLTSIIHSDVSNDYLIKANSAVNSNTNGNQSISYIQLEGGSVVTDLVGYGGFITTARNNVSVHHCTIRNFFARGVVFYGGASIWHASPALTVWNTGNSFHDNTMTNCAKTDYGSSNSSLGCLGLNGQQGMLVYNNYIRNDYRASGYNGFCIKYYGTESLMKGLKIYNNTLIMPPQQAGCFNFSIELWTCAGGLEIYNNTISGEIDLVNCVRDLSNFTDDTGQEYHVPYPEGAYTFGTRIYNNILGWNSLQPIGRGDGEFGLRIEMNAVDTYVYNNEFKYLSCCILLNGNNSQNQVNTNIYYNIFHHIGNSSGTVSKGWGVRAEAPGGNISFNGYYIYNNVISADPGSGTKMYGITTPYSLGTATNIAFRNNIIQNFNRAAIGVDPCTNAAFTNNIYYNCGASYYGSTSGITLTNNRVINPMFVSSSDFHLQAGSPAINAGILIASSPATADLAGLPIGSPPEIGAYEYGSSANIPTLTTTAISNISANNAQSGGTILSNGGSAVTQAGVCYFTIPGPVIIYNPYTSDYIGSSSWISNMPTLSPGLHYYVRAYAINSAGVGYGNELSFTTPTGIIPARPFLKHGTVLLKYGNHLLK